MSAHRSIYGDGTMQLISYKDDSGNTYWLVYDPCDETSVRELEEVSHKGWDVEGRVNDIDMEELVSLKYFLDQYFSD